MADFPSFVSAKKYRDSDLDPELLKTKWQWTAAHLLHVMPWDWDKLYWDEVLGMIHVCETYNNS